MLTPEQQESKDAVLAGNRRAMARLITQLESTLPEEYRKGRELLETALPHTGNSTRIAVSGVPGVGKSTFIESFGLHLISKGHQVHYTKHSEKLFRAIHAKFTCISICSLCLFQLRAQNCRCAVGNAGIAD